MNVHEFQAKLLFSDFGIPTTHGVVIDNVADSEKILQQFDRQVVVKAQIHAGGRGKGHFANGFNGGVHVAENSHEAAFYVKKMLGNRLITKQTESEGKEVRAVYCCEKIEAVREIYLSLTIDRDFGKPVFMASGNGGVDIESITKENKDSLRKFFVDPEFGLHDFKARELGYSLGLQGELVTQFVNLLKNVYRLFLKKDCSMVEINPLAVSSDNQLIALDAKIAFDDNALYRHPEIENLRDLQEEDKKEIQAARFGLNYVALKGDIACVVNGAGLAMATVDILKQFHGHPANFLDLGSRAGTEQVVEALRIVISAPEIRGVFINVFGGIAQCDVIATGIINAIQSLNISLPMVIRLEGANAELGRKLIKECGYPIVVENDLNEAAMTIIKKVKVS